MKHKSFFTLLATVLMTMSAWAIGPQSLKVTFDGTDNAGWEAGVAPSNQQVANGIISVTQELQSNSKYRGDIKFNKNNDGAKTFAMNPNKDKYIAIKFVGSRPEGALKFEFKNVDNSTWCNIWQYTPASMDATDGKVYYFTLTDDAKYTADHLDADGNFIVRQMNFILADNPNAEANTYQVDWIATFESLEDLKMYAYWNDENTNLTYPLLEVGYRPIAADGAQWDSSTPKVGALAANTTYEVKYSARLFAVEYFLIPDFAPNAIYTLSLHRSNQPAALGAWNFPYKNMPLAASESNVELRANVETATGVAVGASDYSTQKPAMGSASCEGNVWSISVAGCQLTEIEKDADGNSLVALLIANRELGNTGQAHFYTYNAANDASNYPTLTQTGSYAVINTTKMVGYTTLEAAVAVAEHNDVLEIYEDVELGSRINTNDRALTIQGHTGTEVITRKAGYTGLMFLTTGNENAALTVRNLIVDGNNVETSQQVFEASNGKPTTIENVTIQNVNVSNDYGSVICNKSSGVLTLNNVTFQNCTCSGGSNNTPSVIFVGTYHVTLKGNNQFINCGEVPAIRVENNYYMTADGELTNTTPIAIQLGTHIDGNSVVKSCTDKAKFALVNTPFVLANIDNDLVAKDYALMNITQDLGYNTLAEAVAAADADDVIEIRKDVTVSGSRVEIKKAITIQGATGIEKIICGVPANTLMILANDNTDNYDVTFKNLVVDGQNTSRSTQMFDANYKGRYIFENVSVVNSVYSVVTGDVKSNNREVVLKGNNSFSTGIYLNMNKRVSNQGTTHTVAIPLILAGDYAENYAIVTTCDNAALYTAIGATGKAWELYMVTSGPNKELKGRITAHSYDLSVTAAGKATLVLGFDVPVLPTDVKAYTLTNDGSSNVITATEVNSLTANQPVLIIAEEGNYTFSSEAGAILNEAANPTNGCLIGTYTDGTSIDEMTGDNYNYILARGEAGVGFYQVLEAGYSINRNHAYLSCGYNNKKAAAAAPMRIRFSTETATDIHSAAADSSVEKLLIHGVLYIRKADHIYTIDGMMIR